MENLPPTSGSLDLHIRRAHYIAKTWKKADENQHLLHLVGHLTQVQLILLFHYYLLLLLCQDYSDTIAKKCCRDTVQNVMSKFAVNAVQQIDSAIMSGLQMMP